MLLACLEAGGAPPEKMTPVPAPRTKERAELVDQLRREGIRDERVLTAMNTVPRHRFVPKNLEAHAYRDRPLPIGLDQTISQPWVVARMTELVEPSPTDKALEVGTGSGYQAAVLAQLVSHVYTIEILCEHADRAREQLKQLDYENLSVRCGDGYEGWLEHAPFDIIVVTAAPESIPPPLLEQLAPGGRLVIPVGPRNDVQTLTLVRRKTDGSLQSSEGVPVRFVPMTGKAER